MLLRLLEEKRPVDDIVFFDTGWEFPQLVEHVFKVQDYIGREITVLKPEISFNDWMFRREFIAKKGKTRGQRKKGYGWPNSMMRWCTRLKIATINNHMHREHGKGCYQYIGYAADELKRTGCGNACVGEVKDGINRLYPLIYDWDMNEKDCLNYCYERGFDWNGLYRHFGRLSCFCCPLSRIGELRTVRKHYPELWGKMLSWGDAIQGHKRFKNDKTIHDLDRRFAEEDRQLTFWEDLAA